MKSKRGSFVRAALGGTLYWLVDSVDPEREMLLEVEIEKGDPGSPGEYPPGDDHAIILSGKFDDGVEIDSDILEQVEIDPSFQESALEKFPEYTKEDALTDRADNLISGKIDGLKRVEGQGETLLSSEVMPIIMDAVETADGETIAAIYNVLQAKQIRYRGNGFWEYVG